MLDEVVALLAQDDVDEVRMVEEVSVPAGEPQVDDVSVLARAERQVPEDVAREVGKASEEGRPFRAGRARRRRRHMPILAGSVATVRATSERSATSIP